MSGTAGAAPPAAVLGLDLDVRGPWHRTALVQTYLFPNSVRPLPTTGGRHTRTHLRLPSLVATAKEPRMARLSLSEPSLLSSHEYVLFEGFSRSRRSGVVQTRPPPLPSFSRSSAKLPHRTCHQSGSSQSHKQQNQQQVQSCRRPTYIHFSQAIQPSSKPTPVRCHSHNPDQSRKIGDLRPLVKQCHNSLSQGETLSVIGKPCLQSGTQRPTLAAAAGPARTQLHVFLPTEAEDEEADSESVDEGFMDELDSKITSLALQQRAAKTVT